MNPADKGGYSQTSAFAVSARTSARRQALTVGVANVKDPYMQKADHLRLREVSVTFLLPSSLLRTARVTARRLTFGGRNLGLWKSDYEGDDPDVLGLGTTNYGVNQLFTADVFTTPPNRRFIVAAQPPVLRPSIMRRCISQCAGSRSPGSAVVALAGCSTDVKDPTVVQASTIDPIADARVFSLSAQQNFYVAYAAMINNTANYSNETWSGAVRNETNDIARHVIVDTNVDLSGQFWAPMQTGDRHERSGGLGAQGHADVQHRHRGCSFVAVVRRRRRGTRRDLLPGRASRRTGAHAGADARFVHR